MAKNDGVQLCALVVIVVAIVMAVYGFMDVLRRKQVSESSTTDVISRQIRGFGLLILSQVVLLVGGMLCMGFGDGLDKIMKLKM